MPIAGNSLIVRLLRSHILFRGMSVRKRVVGKIVCRGGRVSAVVRGQNSEPEGPYGWQNRGKMTGKRGGDGEIRKDADKVIAKLANFGPRRFYFQIREF